LISPPPPFNACRFELQTTPIRSPAPPLLLPFSSHARDAARPRNCSSELRAPAEVPGRFRPYQ
jgi:hypothetical protein